MKFFMNNSDVFLLPTLDGKNMCVSQDNCTVCNTLVEENMISPPECIQNLIKFSSDETCLYKQIELKNYFIRISNSKLYAFITKPVEIIIKCEKTEEILFLTHNQIIPYGGECTLHKYHEENQFSNLKFTETKTLSSNKQSYIDFEKTPKRKTIPEIQIYSKFEMQQQENINVLKEVLEALPMARDRIDKIRLENPLTTLFDWNFKELIVLGLIWIFGIIAIILTFFICMKKLMTKLIGK